MTKNFDDLDEICTELEEEELNKFDKCFVVKDGQHFYYYRCTADKMLELRLC